MIFQVRTDNHIENSQELKNEIRDEVDAVLIPRFGEQIRRVEIYLQDTNSGSKEGGLDKRCGVEVHLAGYPAMMAEDRGDTVEQAVSGALGKMLNALTKAIGRLQDRGDTVSMSGEAT
ncbi:MAG: HPF/RaiA family ribosome-associated protein [Isosphaeraceae bacterium]